MTKLYTYEHKQCSFNKYKKLVKALFSNGGTALVTGSNAYAFARVGELGLEFFDKEPRNVFEARTFNENMELRWWGVPETLESGDLQGRVVLLTESPLGEKSKEGWKPLTDNEQETLDGQYILWGTVNEQGQNGWVTLFEHRVGRIRVPFEKEDLNGKRYLCLKYREYLGMDDNGNMSVKAERLLGIETYQPEEIF